MVDLTRKEHRWLRGIAAIGSGWGIVGALGIGGLRIALGGVPSPDRILGSFAFMLVYLVPFALAGLALRLPRAVRGGVWLAAGLLGMAGMFTAFSGVTVIFFPAAILLIIVGAANLIHNGGQGIGISVLLIVGMILLSGSAFRALFLREDGQCWEQVLMESGKTMWRTAPFQTSGEVSATGSEVIGITCDTDTISPLESAAAVGLLAVETVGVLLAGRERNQKAAT